MTTASFPLPSAPGASFSAGIPAGTVLELGGGYVMVALLSKPMPANTVPPMRVTTAELRVRAVHTDASGRIGVVCPHDSVLDAFPGVWVGVLTPHDDGAYVLSTWTSLEDAEFSRDPFVVATGELAPFVDVYDPSRSRATSHAVAAASRDGADRMVAVLGRHPDVWSWAALPTARAYRRVGAIAEANELLTRMIERASTTELRIERAENRLELGDVAGAREDLDVVGPTKDSLVTYLSAQIDLREGRAKAAIATFTSLLKAFGASKDEYSAARVTVRELQWARGRAYASLVDADAKNATQAIADFTACADGLPEAYLELARLHAKLENLVAARAALATAQTFAPLRSEATALSLELGRGPLRPPPAPEAETLSLDDVVIHAKFGKGTVSDVSGAGDSAKISVVFGDGTERTLQAKFLKLAGAA